MTEPTAERPKRRRRLGAWIAVTVLLLPVWYVGTWLLCALAISRGYVAASYGQYAAPLFRPLIAYANSEMYGAEGLQRLYCRVMRDDVLSVKHPVTSSDFVIQLGYLSPEIKGRLLLAEWDASPHESSSPSPSTEASLPPHSR